MDEHEASASTEPARDIGSATLIVRARKRALEDPSVELLADYLLISGIRRSSQTSGGGTEGDFEKLFALFPRADVVAADRLRCRLEDAGVEQAKRDAIARQLRSSRWERARRWWKSGGLLVQVLSKIPWTGLVLVAGFLLGHTVFRARVTVVGARLEIPPIPYNDEEIRSLKANFGMLWISKFASGVLNDLPAACTQELATGAPSVACSNDTYARLAKISVCEAEELKRIDTLDGEVKAWSPRLGTDALRSARLLFEPDFVTTQLWPVLFAGTVSPLPDDGDATSPVAKYRVNGARRSIAQYRELVQRIVDTSDAVMKLLAAHERTTRNGHELKTVYLSLTLYNGGQSDSAPLEFQAPPAELLSASGAKTQVNVVELSPYSRVPVSGAKPSGRVVVPKGAASQVDVAVNCAGQESICESLLAGNGPWSLAVKDADWPWRSEFTFSLSASPTTVAGANAD